MRPHLLPAILLGLLAAPEPAAAAGHVPDGACGHACGHGHCETACAQFPRYDCLPLPPIAFSRYADNGDYACTRAVYGDGYPKHPLFCDYWYGYRQPYPLTHTAVQNSAPAVRVVPNPPLIQLPAGN